MQFNFEFLCMRGLCCTRESICLCMHNFHGTELNCGKQKEHLLAFVVGQSIQKPTMFTVASKLYCCFLNIQENILPNAKAWE